MQNLTKKEVQFLKEFLETNGCGAQTFEDLLDDNFSCQCVDDLVENISFTHKQIDGLLSSLEQKGILNLEKRDGRLNKTGAINFEPDLYWVSEDFLKENTGSFSNLVEKSGK